jgi:hypothetical protein
MMAPRPIIRPGDKKSAVIEAKKLTVSHLKKFGKDDLAAGINVRSNVYGQNAVKGVRYVQRRFKLAVDGVVGPNTWKVLDYARKPKPPVPVLVVMTRNQWDARPAKGVTVTNWTSSTITRVHHTVTPKPSGSGKDLITNEMEEVRSIQNFHMNSRKWNDIGYNFLIAPSGRVYEGRGKEVVGAHTEDHNHDCGIAFMGNYDTDELTRAQITAFNLLRRKLGIAKGAKVPHSATSSTSCPGKNAKRQLGL